MKGEIKMKKIFYVVSMNYCAGYLGMSQKFDRYSTANDFALNCIEDKDNTYITVEEIEIKGIFKKKYNSKIIAIYNEE